MKLRQLESLLGSVDAFEKPKFALEQYPTSAHLAACIVHTAAGFGDVEDRVVVDLGCGGGVLALGAALCGAAHVVRTHLGGAHWQLARQERVCRHLAVASHLRLSQVGVDVDDDALSLTAENAAQFEDLHVDLVRADVRRLPLRLSADTVIMCDTMLRG